MFPNYSGQKGDGNAYVADMTHHAHVGDDNETTILIGAPKADDTVLLASTTVAASTNYDVDVSIPETFGRNIVVESTDAGDVTIVGFDYLNQPMVETLTCVIGDIDGKKAFKRITRIEASAGLAGDIIIKAGQEFGLPVVGVEIIREVVDGVAGTEGTITAADSNTPTATTGDPRGTFNPNVAPNGAKDIELTFVTTNRLTGGLYGQAHYAG